MSESDQKRDERDDEIAKLAARVDALEASFQDLTIIFEGLSSQRSDRSD